MLDTRLVDAKIHINRLDEDLIFIGLAIQPDSFGCETLLLADGASFGGMMKLWLWKMKISKSKFSENTEK